MVTDSTTANIAAVKFIDPVTGTESTGTSGFYLGGEHLGTLDAVEQTGGGYSLALLGKDIGYGMDLYITGGTDSVDDDFADALTGRTATYIKSLGRNAFVELQDASDAPWAGARSGP